MNDIIQKSIRHELLFHIRFNPFQSFIFIRRYIADFPCQQGQGLGQLVERQAVYVHSAEYPVVRLPQNSVRNALHRREIDLQAVSSRPYEKAVSRRLILSWSLRRMQHETAVSACFLHSLCFFNRTASRND